MEAVNIKNTKEGRNLPQRLVALGLSLIMCWQFLPVTAAADTTPRFRVVDVESTMTDIARATAIKTKYAAVKGYMDDVYTAVDGALTAIDDAKSDVDSTAAGIYASLTDVQKINRYVSDVAALAKSGTEIHEAGIIADQYASMTDTEKAAKYASMTDAQKSKMLDCYVAAEKKQKVEEVKTAKQGAVTAAVEALESAKDEYIRMWADFCEMCPGTLPTTAGWNKASYSDLYNAVYGSEYLNAGTAKYDLSDYDTAKKGRIESSEALGVFMVECMAAMECFAELKNLLVGTGDSGGLVTMLCKCANALYSHSDDQSQRNEDLNWLLTQYKAAEAAVADRSTPMTANRRQAQYAKWVGSAKAYYTLSLKSLDNTVKQSTKDKILTTASAGRISGYMPTYEAERFTQAITLNMSDWTALASKGSPTPLDTMVMNGFAAIISTLEKLEPIAQMRVGEVYSPFCEEAVKKLETTFTGSTTEETSWGVTKESKVRNHLRLQIAQMQAWSDISGKAGGLMTTAAATAGGSSFDLKMNAVNALALKSQMDLWLTDARDQYEDYDEVVRAAGTGETGTPAGVEIYSGVKADKLLTDYAAIIGKYETVQITLVKNRAQASYTSLNGQYLAASQTLGQLEEDMKAKAAAYDLAQAAAQQAMENYENAPEASKSNFSQAAGEATTAMGTAKRDYEAAETAYNTQGRLVDDLAAERASFENIMEKPEDYAFNESGVEAKEYDSSNSVAELNNAISSCNSAIQTNAGEIKAMYASLTNLLEENKNAAPQAKEGQYNEELLGKILRYKELLAIVEQHQRNLAKAQKALIMVAEPTSIADGEKRAQTSLREQFYAQRDVEEFKRLEYSTVYVMSLNSIADGSIGAYWRNAAAAVKADYDAVLDHSSADAQGRFKTLSKTSYKFVADLLNTANGTVDTALEELTAVELREEKNMTTEAFQARKGELEGSGEGSYALANNKWNEQAKIYYNSKSSVVAGNYNAGDDKYEQSSTVGNFLTNAGAMDSALQYVVQQNDGALAGNQDLMKWLNAYNANKYRESFVEFKVREAEWVTADSQRSSLQARKEMLGEQFVLQVDTGATAGTDKILFLTVAYQDTDGVVRKEYIFPSIDGIRKTQEEVQATVNKSDWKDWYVNKDHIQTMRDLGQGADLGGRTALAQYSSDYYMFTTKYAVSPDRVVGKDSDNKDIKNLDIKYFEAFGRNMEIHNQGGKNEWSLSGMSLYKVSDFYGMSSYGYGGTLGGQMILEFEGQNVAWFDYDAHVGHGLEWTTDKHFSFCNEGDVTTKYTNSGFFEFHREADYYATPKVGAGSVGGKIEKVSDEDSEYLFELNISDVYGAGVEPLVNFVTKSDTKTPIKNMGLAECLTLQMVYEDTKGTRRVVDIPVITSSLAWAVNHNVSRDDVIFGYAQQSDSIVFSAYLPDMVEIQESSLMFNVVDKWGDTSGVTGGKAVTDSIADRQATIKDRDKEIHLDSLQIYAPGSYTATATVEKGVIVPTVTGNPAYRMEAADTRYGVVVDYGVRFNMGKSVLNKVTNYRELEKANPYEDYYMVILKTAPNGTLPATTNNPEVKIDYTTLSGKQATSAVIKTQDAGKDFYGYWPGLTSSSADSTKVSQYSDVATSLITGGGGEVKLLYKIQDIEKFNDIKITLDSEATDDWQISEIKIIKIAELSKRYGEWVKYDPLATNTSFVTDRKYDRMINIDAGDQCIWSYAPEKWENYILVRPGETQIVAVGEGEQTFVDKEPDIDWSDVRYSMDEVTAMSDLGFKLGRVNYRVAVKVAGEGESSLANGDCGSVNNFYFQLVFANGKSSYILGNQQLSGDGFRTGFIENLTIKTNRDYGELKAVRIIPDDVSDDSQIYDKLNIEEISVYRQSDNAVNRTWVIKNVGWIGFDYHDEGEETTPRGRRARAESEIAHSYPVSYATYSTKLLFALSTEHPGKPSQSEIDEMTEGYAVGSKEYNEILTALNTVNQYSGQVHMKLTYLDTKGVEQTSEYDIVSAMADFAGRTVKAAESADKIGDTIGTSYLSDINYMFRVGHTDRFEVEVQDLAQLRGAEIVAKGVKTQSTFWDISALTVSMITGDGALNINTNDEYDKTNDRMLVCQDMGGDHKLWCPAANTVSAQITFTTNELTVEDEGESWEVVKPRIPDTETDSINVYVYFDNDNKTADDSGKYSGIIFGDPNNTSGAKYNDLRCEAIYSTNHDLVYKSAKRSMTMISNPYDGLSCCAAFGIDVSDIAVLNKINLSMYDLTADLMLDHIVVQRIREEVVLSTYTIDLSGFKMQGAGSYAPDLVQSTVIEAENGKQVLTLGFTGKNDAHPTENARLIAENRDIAVALRYTSKNDEGYTTRNTSGGVSKVTYRSAYVYLTDQQIYSIASGGTAEITFHEKYLDEITEVCVFATGGLKAAVDRASVAVYKEDNTSASGYTRTAWYDLVPDTPEVLGPGEAKLTPLANTTAFHQTANPMRVNFVTANVANAAPYGDVEMTVTYTDRVKGDSSLTFNVRDNLVEGAITNNGTSKEDRTAVVRVMLPNVIDLKQISLSFPGGSAEDAWVIEEMWLEYDQGVNVVRRGPYAEQNLNSSYNPTVTYLVEQRDNVELKPHVYVNGVEQPENATTIEVHQGDIVQLYPETIINAVAQNRGKVSVKRKIVTDIEFKDVEAGFLTLTPGRTDEWQFTATGIPGESYEATFSVEGYANTTTRLIKVVALDGGEFFLGDEDGTKITSLTLTEGDGEFQLVPQNAKGEVRWFSSNSQIVTVEDGLVKATAFSKITDTAKITAVDGAGRICECEIHFKNAGT